MFFSTLHGSMTSHKLRQGTSRTRFSGLSADCNDVAHFNNLTHSRSCPDLNNWQNKTQCTDTVRSVAGIVEEDSCDQRTVDRSVDISGQSRCFVKKVIQRRRKIQSSNSIIDTPEHSRSKIDSLEASAEPRASSAAVRGGTLHDERYCKLKSEKTKVLRSAALGCALPQISTCQGIQSPETLKSSVSYSNLSEYIELRDKPHHWRSSLPGQDLRPLATTGLSRRKDTGRSPTGSPCLSPVTGTTSGRSTPPPTARDRRLKYSSSRKFAWRHQSQNIFRISQTGQHVTIKDLKLLKNCFDSLDVDSSGQVDIMEITNHLNAQSSNGASFPPSLLRRMATRANLGDQLTFADTLSLCYPHANRSEIIAMDNMIRPKEEAEEGNAIDPDEELDVEQMWKLWDMDGSGELDAYELKQALRSLITCKREFSIRLADFDDIFESMDLDKSGTIDIDEFKTWWFSDQRHDYFTYDE